ncbi:Methyltransferase type 11 [Hirsutella rhossiliensis]|uniref:Methyltransferase type 11 n=1 Tax=Hirsutella rhossiliensis TaxID=111463 RepID=A0A9P8MXX6_9HYPO|nr:Methyltransferase type 11 [Hirsutella rhossiliensis]KAH0961182.1 Methyltransferase type 11 [Hirsutella rhossiliensis]
MTSIDASIASEGSRLQLRKESSRGSNDSYLTAKNPQKRARTSRKWNLFGRSHSRPNTKGDGEEVQATVIAVEKKRVAFYAMMDSAEQADAKPTSFVENLLEHRPLEMPQPTTMARSQPPSAGTHDAWNEAVPLTSRSQVPGPTPSSGKRGRLPQVGRIPHVVSRRPDNISPQTFSRPFRNSLQASPRITLDVYDPESIATGPTPPKPSTPVLGWTTEEPAADSEINSSSYRDSISKLSSEVTRGEREFLAFPSRKSSVKTVDTSSSSSRDICILADATAVIPKAHDPPDEDEIWDEYNDLLDEDSGRMLSTPMTLGVGPLRLKRHHSRSIKASSVQSAVVPGDWRKASTHSKAPTHSTSGSADMTERIRRAFQPHPNQTAVVRASDGESSLDKQRHDALPANVHISGSNRNSSASVNLRVGSMTVSKWLSFGHVLFSDIRHELDLAKDPPKKHSILVIDGLGNDDWSFYAAETYPTASFYNLSPRAALPAEMRSSPSSFPLSPPNHHQVQYTSHLDKFPFAAQSFNGLVYRFPVAAPESHYRNIINEARRVLRPGGYIELSVLDVDLNSMGNRGRRTVRCLKEQIHDEAAEINLASTADLILRLLGKAGFSSIRAARVGVPVASSITRSNVHKTERKDKSTSSLADMMRDKSPMADESITKLVARVGRWWYTRCYESATGTETDRSIWANKALLSECEELGTSLKLMVCCARAPNRVPSF